jgi:Ca2+-binding EF-hand superfamily protein
MGKNSSIPEKDVKELLDSLDLDDDGQVTLNDVIEIMTKSFK